MRIESDKIAREYKVFGKSLLAILNKERPDLNVYFTKNAVEIVEELLQNVWDDELFTKFFDLKIDYIRAEHMIDYEDFNKCLEFIEVSGFAYLRLFQF